ncbi:MAG TPA: BadF/BadG/BcrA/BcrD ATPase family protein [Chloroflexota bacterium]|nr:BadF/BadG/BcrA/BcrD ATPase family protein [Chloroflexota bacterium]
MTTRYYAGIDAGGTGTRCVIADEQGTILGIGQGGPGNALISGHDRALYAVREALDGAWAGHAAQPLAQLHIAIAGTVVPDGVQELAQRWSSTDDTVGAFAGALVHGPGIIVIAGTGSACYGETGDVRRALIGGWGPLIGDEGSAHAIGRGALTRLSWALDGRVPCSPLIVRLLEHLQVRDRRSLQERIYAPPLLREQIAALAGMVAGAAATGDPQASALLREAGEDLGHAVGDLAHILGLQDTAMRVATLGGVFRAGALVLEPFQERVRQAVPGATLVAARFPPVIGALILAYRAAGLVVDGPLLAHLEASYRRRNC